MATPKTAKNLPYLYEVFLIQHKGPNHLVRCEYGDARIVTDPRTGLRKYGVPPGGPFDRESYHLSQALTGQPEDTQTIELTCAVATISAEADLIVSLVGGGHELEVSGRPSPINCRIFVQSGQTIKIHPTRDNYRCLVSITESTETHHELRLAEPPTSLDPTTIRFIPMSHELEFVATTTPDLSRVGLRFKSDLNPRVQQNQASRHSVCGAMQLAPNGEVLIHGPDGPTIGGYDFIGVVIQADLDKLAQIRPETGINFVPVTLPEAQAVTREKEEELEYRIRALQLRLRK